MNANEILAWDPDFTKVTPEERERLVGTKFRLHRRRVSGAPDDDAPCASEIEEAEREFERGEYCTENEIDWN